MKEKAMSEQQWRRFVLRWMGLSLLFHFVAAWFSVGHHSVDEYFQILEFLSYKRGLTPASDLAVEFHERMRPWMQPFLYAQMVRVWEWVGVHNPFTWAWSFRLATGLLGWASALGLAWRARDWFPNPKAQRFCVWALALIWFYPALHVRPSSESLGGSAFLAGLVLLTGVALHASHRRDLGTAARLALGGALLGLSFEARFQMGFMIAGLALWLVVVPRQPGAARQPARLPWQKLALAAAGFLVVFGLGRWADRWGYGEWVMSPWRYVQYNLVRGEVNRFGHAPVWDVFRMSFTESWPFIGLALAIASVVAWIRHPKHPLTWSQVPFFLVHEMIPHKELRFFFPIALAGPTLLTMSLFSARAATWLEPSRWLRSRPARALWGFLLANNGVALAVLLFVPFSRPVRFYESVWDLIPPDARRFEILYSGTDPYHLLGNPVYFYRPPALVTKTFNSYAELEPRLLRHETLFVFSDSVALPSEAHSIAPDCAPAIRMLPPWMARLDFNGWVERAHPWTLFRCRSSF